MEEFSSYLEQFNQAEPLLSQWRDHLVKVEVELRKLAQKFYEWDVEAKGTTTDPTAANVAGSANGLSCVFESSCSGSIQDLINNTVELLEQDTMLTENLTETIESLKEKLALLQEKFHEFDNSRDVPFPHDAEYNASIASVWLLNLSNQSLSLSALGKIVCTKSSFKLTEYFRNITNLAFGGSQSLDEVALQLRTIADVVEKCRLVRCGVVASMAQSVLYSLIISQMM